MIISFSQLSEMVVVSWRKEITYMGKRLMM